MHNQHFMDIASFITNLSAENILDRPAGQEALTFTKSLLAAADAEWERAINDELRDKVIIVAGQPVINPDLISDARMPEYYDNKRILRPFVDLVQQGGGMYGIALVGYCYVLERAGIRFNSLGGASSGAICTMLLGALPKTIYSEASVLSPGRQACKSELITHIIANTDFSKFLERRGIVGRIQLKFLRRFNLRLLRKIGIITAAAMLICYFAFSFVFRTDYGIVSDELRLYDFILGTIIAALPVVFLYIILVRVLGRNFGINAGHIFYNWMDNILSLPEIAINSSADLRRRLDECEFEVNGQMAAEHPKMVLITANLTHNRIVKFPDAAADYWSDPAAVNPAAYVRASMSIPFLFDTFIPTERHVNGANKLVKLKARFVDGGMLSNFPIREFHVRSANKPRFPTFGVLLNENTSEGKGVPDAKVKPEPFPPVSFGKFLISFFSTFRNFYDNDFLYQNEEIRSRIETVNTDGLNWLDFWMTDAQKQQLFAEGARAAVRQLKKFNWNDYKNLR